MWNYSHISDTQDNVSNKSIHKIWLWFRQFLNSDVVGKSFGRFGGAPNDCLTSEIDWSPVSLVCGGGGYRLPNNEVVSDSIAFAYSLLAVDVSGASWKKRTCRHAKKLMHIPCICIVSIYLRAWKWKLNDTECDLQKMNDIILSTITTW